MIGSLKEKRNIRLNKRRRVNQHYDDMVKQDEFIKAKNYVASVNDIDNRFSEYKDDLSIGNMYQRKKKHKKSKAKRCGCES
jgi:hypothetical protein